MNLSTKQALAMTAYTPTLVIARMSLYGCSYSDDKKLLSIRDGSPLIAAEGKSRLNSL